MPQQQEETMLDNDPGKKAKPKPVVKDRYSALTFDQKPAPQVSVAPDGTSTPVPSGSTAKATSTPTPSPSQDRYSNLSFTPQKKNDGANSSASGTTPISPSSSSSASPSPGLRVKGNIDLEKQPSVDNPETGGKSTVWSTSFGTDEGEVLVSRVTPDGKILSEKEAEANYRKTGKHLGIFDTPENATKYAKQLHEDYQSGKIKAAELPKKDGSAPFNGYGQYDAFRNPLNEKPAPATISVAGAPVTLDMPTASPIGDFQRDTFVKDLQQRIDTKTFNKADINTVAGAMKVSPQVATTYMNGKAGQGYVQNFNEVKQKQQDVLKGAVAQANKDLGQEDNFDQNFATVDAAAAYLQKLDRLYADKSKREGVDAVEKANAANPMAFDPIYYPTVNDAQAKATNTAAQKIRSVVSNDIIDKISRDQTLSRDQKVARAYQLTDPKDKDLSENAITNRLKPLGFANDLFSNNLFNPLNPKSTTHDRVEMLNAGKASVEFKLNRSIQEQAQLAQAQKLAILEELNDKVTSGQLKQSDQTGMDYYRHRIANADSNIARLNQEKQTDKEVYEKYPVLQKAAIAALLNDYHALTSGNVKGESDFIDFNRADHFESEDDYLRNNGIDPDSQIVKDVRDGDMTKDYSVLGRPIQNIIETFTNTAKGLGDLAAAAGMDGFRDEADVLAEKKQAELFPTQVGENDEYQLRKGVEITQSIGNTTGQVIGQGLLQSATAGLGRMVGLSKLAALNTAFYASGAVPSYDAAYKDSYDFIDNKAGRVAYAGLIALSNAASEKIFPDIKLFQIQGVGEKITDIAKRVGGAGFTDELAREMLGQTRNVFVKQLKQYGKEFGKNVGEEVVEEVATQLFEDYNRFLFGDPKMNIGSAMENAKNTAYQTATGMLGIGAWGAYKDIKKEKNVAAKATIYNAAVYHDAAVDAINLGFTQGLYDETERDAKIKTVNTARAAGIAMLRTQQVTGTVLDRPKRELYVGNLTAEAMLTQQLKGADAALTKTLEEKIANLQAQRKEILDGKVDIDANGDIVKEKVKVKVGTPPADVQVGGVQVQGKKIFLDFDETLWDNKTQGLTSLGEEVAAKIKSGEIKPEDVQVLTKRENMPKNIELISQKLGISRQAVKAGMDANDKAAIVDGTSGEKVFFNDNQDELDKVQTGQKVNVKDIVSPNTNQNEKVNESGGTASQKGNTGEGGTSGEGGQTGNESSGTTASGTQANEAEGSGNAARDGGVLADNNDAADNQAASLNINSKPTRARAGGKSPDYDPNAEPNEALKDVDSLTKALDAKDAKDKTSFWHILNGKQGTKYKDNKDVAEAYFKHKDFRDEKGQKYFHVDEVEKAVQSQTDANKATEATPEASAKEHADHIAELEKQRDAEIAKVGKPELTLPTLPATDPNLKKPTGEQITVATKGGRTTTRPETYQDKQDDIVARMNILQDLLNCL